IKVELFYRKNSPICATNGALIQFASMETVNRAGLSIQKTFSAYKEHAIEAPAETKFDETHFTVVTISVPALVTRWMVSPGNSVEKNDILATLNSPEIAELQAALLSAHSDYEVHQKDLARFEELKLKNLISPSEYDREESENKKSLADLNSARGMLLAAGFNDTDIEKLIETGQVNNELHLRAPEKGIVVERKAQLGELLAEGSAYAMIADPNSMWIEASLSEQEIRGVKKGQLLTFTSDGRGLNRIGGKIIWVSRYLDPHTRTGIVRASVIGDAPNFHSGEFGHVNISENTNTSVTLVPKDAVQWEGCCNVVFVKEAEDRYRPRKVELTEGTGPYYQITNGLKPGEEVVVDGAFLLKTELKKTSIGAGCCGLETAG
ncbi:MAG: efflux RND transporter periplasmic adaptor subunit, partial [Candidatus Zixiibacteriota bacterium]